MANKKMGFEEGYGRKWFEYLDNLFRTGWRGTA
jgi:hypothetical protein